MQRYRTEIVVPPDRYVCLQLPADAPEGHATVSVWFHERTTGRSRRSFADDAQADPDRQDIEWWEEFDDDPESVR